MQALMLTARAKEQESTVLQERATAVLAAAAAGSNRAMLALYRFYTHTHTHTQCIQTVPALAGANNADVC